MVTVDLGRRKGQPLHHGRSNNNSIKPSGSRRRPLALIAIVGAAVLLSFVYSSSNNDPPPSIELAQSEQLRGSTPPPPIDASPSFPEYDGDDDDDGNNASSEEEPSGLFPPPPEEEEDSYDNDDDDDGMYGDDNTLGDTEEEESIDATGDSEGSLEDEEETLVWKDPADFPNETTTGEVGEESLEEEEYAPPVNSTNTTIEDVVVDESSEEGEEEGDYLEQDYDVCIVGAGLSGAVLAERYASQLESKVLVIDKRDHIGGNCYDYLDEETNIRVSKYGAHLFHTQYPHVADYVQTFGVWEEYHHKVRGLVNGSYVPIPVNIETVNTLFDLNISSAEEMEEWLSEEQVALEDGDEPKNSEEVALSRVGPRLYELIFKPYTFKQWAKYPAELGPEVLARIPVRPNFEDGYFMDDFQALPRDGYTSLFVNMFDSPLITVQTEVDYFDVQDALTEKCGRLYFSGKIDAYYNDTGWAPLEYRSLDFERVVVENETGTFQPYFVVNHPQPDDDYTRIVEYKHLPGNSDSNKTVYFIERSKDGGEPYYPVPNDENKQLFLQYQELAQKEENVTFVGRLANYKYFNMDEAIKNALDLFAQETGLAYTGEGDGESLSEGEETALTDTVPVDDESGDYEGESPTEEQEEDPELAQGEKMYVSEDDEEEDEEMEPVQGEKMYVSDGDDEMVDFGDTAEEESVLVSELPSETEETVDEETLEEQDGQELEPEGEGFAVDESSEDEPETPDVYVASETTEEEETGEEEEDGEETTAYGGGDKIFYASDDEDETLVDTETSDVDETSETADGEETIEEEEDGEETAESEEGEDMVSWGESEDEDETLVETATADVDETSDGEETVDEEDGGEIDESTERIVEPTDTEEGEDPELEDVESTELAEDDEEAVSMEGEESESEPEPARVSTRVKPLFNVDR